MSNRKDRRAKERAAATPQVQHATIARVIPEAPKKPFATTDSFANFASRVGAGIGMDNQLSQSLYTFTLLTRNRIQLEAAYRGSWVVGAVVDAVAEDMTRAGIVITTSEGAEDIEDLQAALSRKRIWNSYQDVIKWARLYGGSLGVLMIEGQDMSTPLQIDRIQKGGFQGITVFDRWQLNPDLTEVVRSGPDIGLPAYYYIITTADIAKSDIMYDNTINKMQGGIKVHHSRVIRHVGIKLPYFQAITEMMWGMSEIERLHDRLVSFDNSTMSAANLINHANLRTVQVEGLREVFAAGGDATNGLYAMFDMMRVMQSNEGLTLLDGADKFESTAYSFSGLSDMMLQFGQQLSGASGIPLVRLFGQAPAGLNSTGESDFRNYYDKINAKQESDMRPSVEKILKVVHQSEFGRPAPKDMQFTFASLWQQTAKEKADTGQVIATTVTGVYEAGGISKSTMLKELRQHSPQTGMFTNITDEDISDAEGDDVPMPGDTPAPAPEEKKSVVNTAIDTLKKYLGGK